MTIMPRVRRFTRGMIVVYLKKGKGNLLNHSTNIETLNSMLNDSTRGGSSIAECNHGNSGEVPES